MKPKKRAILNEVLSCVPSKRLYHYTTQSGLLGIIKSRTLWATHHQYLNDQREFLLALEIAREEIEYLSKNILPQEADAETRKELLGKCLKAFEVTTEGINVCVASFSEDGDSLSQWRAYGGSSGFAIGFDPAKLKLAADNAGWSLAPCIYDLDRQRATIRALIEEVLEEYGSGAYKVELTPDSCPICHRAIIPIDWNVAYLAKDDSVERLLQCPNDICRRLFLAQYMTGPEGTTSALRFQRCVPTELLTPAQSETIKVLSQDFCNIFGEAHKAEQYGLLLVAGPGYRKAFEFLIKDYAKTSNPPEDKDRIEKMQLADCITTYIEDERIKQIARRATWLANDEVHYVRKWVDKDLKDVKSLIELTLHSIEIEHLTK